MPFRLPDDRPSGIGLGLRWAFARKLAAMPAADRGPLQFLEVAPENFMRRGGGLKGALEQLHTELPILTHGLMLNVGGTDPFDRQYLGDLRRFIEHMGGRFHTDHLCWTGAGGRVLHDLLPLSPDRSVVEHVVGRVQEVQDAIGVPLGLENISYYMLPPGGLPEGEFVARVVEQADCGMLLDVNNVVVNAINHDFDEFAYVDGLPLDRVLYLHIAGGERKEHLDGLLIDTHGSSVSERVQALMASVVQRIGPVPVLYERDNSIPPLSELLDEVRELDRVYQRAVEKYRGSADARRRAETERDEVVLRSQPAVERGLAGMIREAAPEAAFMEDPAGALEARGVDPADAGGLARWGGERLLVYRSLVRGGVFDVLRNFMPRARARRGEAAFEEDLAIWMEQVGPVSQVLAEVPLELAEWLRGRWGDDPAVPDFLPDLARHEVMEQTVRGAPDGPAAPVAGEDVQLDAPLVFQRAARIVTYDHAIHELPASLNDRGSPPAGHTALLAYRDGSGGVRWLHLTRLAEEVLQRLLAGATVREAITRGAVAAGEEMGDDVLVRITHLLADLGDRGALVGRGA